MRELNAASAQLQDAGRKRRVQQIWFGQLHPRLRPSHCDVDQATPTAFGEGREPLFDEVY
jgi:hypothetical protein